MRQRSKRDNGAANAPLFTIFHGWLVKVAIATAVDADVGSSTCGGYSGLDMDVNLTSKQYVEVCRRAGCLCKRMRFRVYIRACYS